MKYLLELRTNLFDKTYNKIVVLKSSIPQKSFQDYNIPDADDYSIFDFKNDLKEISGYRLPIIDYEMIKRISKLPAGLFYRELSHLVAIFRRRLAGDHFHVRGPYRPSTGMCALLWAIKNFGTEVKYRTAGVDFTSRNRHAIHFHNEQCPDPLPQHEIADRAILRRLMTNRRYALEIS